MQGVCIPTGYLAHGNSEGEARGINKNNGKRVVRNMKRRNMGTKGKRPKQDLTRPRQDITRPRQDPNKRIIINNNCSGN